MEVGISMDSVIRTVNATSWVLNQDFSVEFGSRVDGNDHRKGANKLAHEYFLLPLMATALECVDQTGDTHEETWQRVIASAYDW
jgi:hypothetical protein